jgi:hypothetical protein
MDRFPSLTRRPRFGAAEHGAALFARNHAADGEGGFAHRRQVCDQASCFVRRDRQNHAYTAIERARHFSRLDLALRLQERHEARLLPGIGVDPRYHRRIFEKFFQVEDPLTRHHGGAGLGLFVAKGIVEAHGSRIEVESRLGQGASFAFDLPMLVKRTPEADDRAVVPDGDKP